jgi:5-oxoprolinase (ATP-hydrolysing)
VAALLGISTVVVPPDAGLLSAAGLGAAVIERFRERQVLAPLAEVEGEIGAWLADLGREAAAAVVAEGLTREDVEVRRRMVHLRLLGQEAALPIEWSEAVDLGVAFAAAYECQYGYRPPAGRAVEVESLQAVASSRQEPIQAASWPEACGPGRGGRDASSRAAVRSCFESAWREVPGFARADLATGDRLTGPALVLEAHATTVVPPGWEGKVAGSGALVLTAAG